jgi:hypothetical protein
MAGLTVGDNGPGDIHAVPADAKAQWLVAASNEIANPAADPAARKKASNLLVSACAADEPAEKSDKALGPTQATLIDAKKIFLGPEPTEFASPKKLLSTTNQFVLIRVHGGIRETVDVPELIRSGLFGEKSRFTIKS